LKSLLGFTSDLSTDESYIGSRRSQGSFYPSAYVTSFLSQSKWTGGAVQTKALSGKTMTTLKGVRRQEGNLKIDFLNGNRELASPSLFYGATYEGSGITEITHCELDWWNASNQGWSDGRPVRYFANASDCALTLNTSAQNYASSSFNTWVFQSNGDIADHLTQMFPPAVVYWAFNTKIFEWVG
jgi:hypothetical protein